MNIANDSTYIYIDTLGLQTANPNAPTRAGYPMVSKSTDMLAEDWEVYNN